MRKILEIVAFVLVTQYLSAQNIEVGAEFSYGKTDYTSYLYFKGLFSEDATNYLNFGFSASTNPHKSVLFVNSGLLYNRIYDQRYSLNFFKIPVGIDLAFGNRLKFLFGGGAYINWLFYTKGLQESSKTRDITIGLYSDLGLRYLIVRDWCIYLKTRMEFDQLSLFIDDDGSDEHYYNYGVTIGFKYLIPLKD